MAHLLSLYRIVLRLVFAHAINYIAHSTTAHPHQDFFSDPWRALSASLHPNHIIWYGRNVVKNIQFNQFCLRLSKYLNNAFFSKYTSIHLGWMRAMNNVRSVEGGAVSDFPRRIMVISCLVLFARSWRHHLRRLCTNCACVLCPLLRMAFILPRAVLHSYTIHPSASNNTPDVSQPKAP